mmetsp:Transcript_35100/g.97077  ORF Transcript_35100/g.97077 Transcript_35100/m.97077 type:complete len:207 (-) Transcript_35100:380-1000(-)
MLYMVRTITVGFRLSASASWGRCNALRALVPVHHGGATPRQRIPLASNAAIPCGRDDPVNDALTSNRVALRLPDILAFRHRTSTHIERDIWDDWAKQRNLEAQYPRDVVFPGAHGHNLVVEVPEQASKIRSVHVLQGVVDITLGTVHVNGLGSSGRNESCGSCQWSGRTTSSTVRSNDGCGDESGGSRHGCGGNCRCGGAGGSGTG